MEEEIQLINDKITQEIRLNRAIKAEIDHVFRMPNNLYANSHSSFTRSCDFIDELFRKYEELKYKVSKSRKVSISELSALLKSLEVEEKYLIDRYYKTKAHCTVSYFASTLFAKTIHSPSTSQTPKSTLLIIFTLLLIIILLVIYYFSFKLPI